MTLQGRVSPFGYPRIKGCSHLPTAFRRVPRPSSPLGAKASTKCPSRRLHVTFPTKKIAPTPRQNEGMLRRPSRKGARRFGINRRRQALLRARLGIYAGLLSQISVTSRPGERNPIPPTSGPAKPARRLKPLPKEDPKTTDKREALPAERFPVHLLHFPINHVTKPNQIASAFRRARENPCPSEPDQPVPTHCRLALAHLIPCLLVEADGIEPTTSSLQS